MAKKFLSSLKIVNLPSDPISGSEGELYFNSSASVAKIYQAGAWSVLGAGAGGGTTVSTTEPASPEIGDSWYKNDTGEFYVYDGTYWVEVNGTISASGALTNISSITYPDYITFDTTPETIPTEQGSIYWDSGDGLPATVLNANVSIGLGQEQVSLVKNATGSSIAKGKVVYINGAQGQRPTITLSDADTETTSSKTFGVTSEVIADGAEGFVTTFGVLRGVNTNGLTEGAPIWLSTTAGNFTTTIPAEPAHSVFIGYVVKAHASSGEIFINIQNGYELDELHGVKINGTNEDQVLRYDEVAGLWVNTHPNLITARNVTESTISAFTPVYINTQEFDQDNITFAPADAASAMYLAKLPADAITTASVANNAYGKLVTMGVVEGIDLTGYSVGDLLYVAVGGGLTSVRPTGANAIQPFARVISTDNGTIYVYGNTFVSSTENLPNLETNKIWLGTSGRPAQTTLNSSIVPENTNLYFTDERAQDAAAELFTSGIHTGASVEYNDSTGKLNITNTGVTALYGTSNEIEVSSNTGGVTVSLPDVLNLSASVSIGDVSSNEISTLNGVTSSIQTQLDGKALSVHTHTSSDITDFNESVQDVSASLIVGGSHTNITATYNDSTGTLNLAAAPGYTDEEARDAVATMFTSASNSYISVAHDDVNNLITLSNDGVVDVVGVSGQTSASVISGTAYVGLTSDVDIANNLTVGGNLSVSGSLSYANDLVISDPLIYIGEGNNANLVDLGIVASFNDGAYQHSGIVRDATDDKWKLFSSVEDEPTTTVNFAQAEYDTLMLGKLENTGQEIVLNSNQSGSASLNASIVVERGTDTNVSLRWNESSNEWEYTNDGSTYNAIGSGGGGGSSAAAVTSDPPASPELNQVWQDLDTGRIYVWDGDFWIEVQQNGSLGLLRYLGAASTAPATSIDGSALQTGEVYFDTVFNGMKVYDGTAWEDAFSAASLSVSRWVKTAIGGETYLSGNDDSSLTLVYTPGIEEVYLNGVKLIRGSDYIASSGSVISNLEPLIANSVVEVISYSGFELANTYTKAEVDDLIQKKGVRWIEVMGAGTSITTLTGTDDYGNTLAYTPGTEQVFINGLLIARGIDYTATDGTSVVLNEALSPGDIVEISGTSTFSVANVYSKTEVDNKLEDFMMISLSDEISTVVTGTAKVTMRAPFAMTLTQIPRASLNTASSSGIPTIDIKKNGTTILGANKLTIDANEKTSVTAATATTLATTAIANDDEITFDVTVAGTGAKGLKVVLYYTRA